MCRCSLVVTHTIAALETPRDFRCFHRAGCMKHFQLAKQNNHHRLRISLWSSRAASMDSSSSVLTHHFSARTCCASGKTNRACHPQQNAPVLLRHIGCLCCFLGLFVAEMKPGRCRKCRCSVSCWLPCAAAPSRCISTAWPLGNWYPEFGRLLPIRYRSDVFFPVEGSTTWLL